VTPNNDNARREKCSRCIVNSVFPHPCDVMSEEENPDTYLVPNADGGWDEVSWPDERLEGLRGALRQLKTKLSVTQIPLSEHFAHSAYAHVGVSRSFFQLTKKTFRGLMRHADRWKFLEYLLFHARPDRKLGLIPVPQKLLAALENKKANHYKALPFLLRFQRDVMSPDTFQFGKGWDWQGHQCRMVTKFILPSPYADALQKEKEAGTKEVFFCGGDKWSQRKAREMLNRKRKAQEVRDSQWISASAKEVIEYMNNSDARPFTAIVRKNYAAAVAAARKLSSKQWKRELPILEAIKKDPKPNYGPSRSKKTPRIWARGRNSIPQLKRKIRKLLTRGWYEADLKSAQLAINAVLWGAERTRAFLEEDGDIWEMFYEYLDIPPEKKTKEVKGELKKTLYAIWFDREAHLVGPILTTSLRKRGVETDGNAVYSMPFVPEMLEERERAKARINREGGVRDCNGRWIPLKARDAASLMAEAAQVAEMELLLPVVRLAKTTNDFQITLYQHDGISLLFRKDKKEWIDRIDGEVRKKAKEFGFPTGLDWEEL
jgi:hypothetical protein